MKGAFIVMGINVAARNQTSFVNFGDQVKSKQKVNKQDLNLDIACAIISAQNRYIDALLKEKKSAPEFRKLNVIA